MYFSSNDRRDIRTTHWTKDEDMGINTMVTTYNTAMADEASEILGKERRRKKSRGSPEIYSTSVMRGEI